MTEQVSDEFQTFSTHSSETWLHPSLVIPNKVEGTRREGRKKKERSKEKRRTGRRKFASLCGIEAVEAGCMGAAFDTHKCPARVHARVSTRFHVGLLPDSEKRRTCTCRRPPGCRFSYRPHKHEQRVELTDLYRPYININFFSPWRQQITKHTQ